MVNADDENPESRRIRLLYGQGSSLPPIERLEVKSPLQPMNEFRVIPSIEQLRQTDVVRQLEEKFGHGITVIGLREEAKLLRDNLKQIPDFVEDSNAATQHIEKNLEKRPSRSRMPSLIRDW